MHVALRADSNSKHDTYIYEQLPSDASRPFILLALLRHRNVIWIRLLAAPTLQISSYNNRTYLEGALLQSPKSRQRSNQRLKYLSTTCLARSGAPLVKYMLDKL